MFFQQFNLEEKTLKILAAVTTIIGIIFILAANSVGNTAIRIASIIGLIFAIMNLKMTYHYIGKIQKMYLSTGIILGVLILIKPQFVMFILGIGLLIVSSPTLYAAIKNRNFEDKIKIGLSVVSFVFAIYCILNSNAALVTVVKIIGALFVVLGCYTFYEWLNINRNKIDKNSSDYQPIYDDYKFENAEEIKQDKDE